MTPERVAALVARWVRCYTRGLPPSVAQRRVDEVAADVCDHVAHERARGADDSRIARSLASRMIRGLVADVSWRGAHTTTRPEETMRTRSTLARLVRRVPLGVAVVLAIPTLAMVFGDAVAWTWRDFVVAGVLLGVIGVTIELARSKSGKPAASVGVAVLGVAAAVFGEADDSPGLVLIGLLLILSAGALAFRLIQRSR